MGRKKSATNQIRISYNPYLKEIQYEYRNGQEDIWRTLDPSSKLASSKFIQGAIQNKAEDIVDALLRDYSTGLGLELFFRGTEQDWIDLQAVVRRVDAEGKIVCRDLEETLPSGVEMAEKIKAVFREIQTEFQGLSEPSIQEPVKKYLDAARPETVLCVAGAYSAGKSTFINALIGEELLPSDSKAKTAKIFMIHSKPAGTWSDTELRFQYRNQPVILQFGPEGYELDNLNQLPDLELKDCLDRQLSEVKPGPSYIYRTLELLNEFNNQCARDDISDLIEIWTPFYHSSLPLDKIEVIVYDTPGSDSDSHADHLKVLQEALKNQTNGLPILLTQRAREDGRSEAELRSQIAAIPALDSSNILIVINKADCIPANTLQKMQSNQEESGQSAAEKGAEKHVFYLSSIVGLGAKKEDMAQCVFEDTCGIFIEQEVFFRDGKKELFLCDKLPADRYERICKNGKQANIEGNDRQRLFHNSGLWALEDEIHVFTKKYAYYNKCQQAKVYLSEAISRLREKQLEKEEELEKSRNQLTSELESGEKDLMGKLEMFSKSWIEKRSTEASAQQKKIREQSMPSSNQLNDKIGTQWKQELKKGGKKAESWGRLQHWARKYTNDRIQHIIEQLDRSAKKYWSERVPNFKERCVEIVRGSSNLTEEQKEFMEEYILHLQEPMVEMTSFTWSDDAFRPFRFLFFDWSDIDRKKCADQMEKAIQDAIALFNQKFGQQVRDGIESWNANFLDGLRGKLTEFNPNLKAKSLEIERYKGNIQALRNAQDKLDASEKRIESFFAFTEDKWQEEIT